MDKTVMVETVADEIRAAGGCMIAAMNNLAGSYGKAYGRCVSDLYYACYHLGRALLASRGIAANSHEAVQRLLALHFVKPAALPQDTIAKLNELMDKRHVADYKSYIAIGVDDIAAFRPWIAGFVRNVLKLLGKAAPVADGKLLQKAADDLERLRLE
ncbi:MAG: HEPN domain-containing protein [Betaproteobacteria bacterium]|nr:HEPN domain-containing protein [Betaproteobacteria bacterium]